MSPDRRGGTPKGTPSNSGDEYSDGSSRRSARPLSRGAAQPKRSSRPSNADASSHAFDSGISTVTDDSLTANSFVEPAGRGREVDTGAEIADIDSRLNALQVPPPRMCALPRS
jgi:hypothetical protein